MNLDQFMRRVVAADSDPHASLDEILLRCAAVRPELAGLRADDLNLTAEVEALQRALVEAPGRPGESLVELSVEVRPRQWRGRVDSCELILGTDPEIVHVSHAIERVLLTACEHRGPASELLSREVPLACAALLVRHALRRIDPRSVLGENTRLPIRVVCPPDGELPAGEFNCTGLR